MALDPENINIPKHIGFVMDGNRRWGKKHKLAKAISGTASGVKALEKAVEASVKRGIKYITVWVLSTENWKRDKDEINYLMDLTREVAPKLAEKYKDSNIRLKFIGEIETYPKDIQKIIKKAEKDTKDGKVAVLNMAASYGGRSEIVSAVKKILKNKIAPEKITEKEFARFIYEKGQPDIDLVVRTGGMIRTSGFMMWQAAYAEYYFTNILWPDFNIKELDKALDYYKSTKRNFGK